jgi:hypothetical protein
VAVTCAVKVSGTKAAVADTLTDTAGVMFMVAAAVWFGSVTELAVIVTVAGVGGITGAT